MRLDGETSDGAAVFPSWAPHDRFGIVIHEPWGAVGASLLIQIAVSEFFRARRELGISDIYPEIYAFHIGRDFGDLSMYDFWPYTKEVVVEADAAKVLLAINDRAITRLAVPDGAREEYAFIWPEDLSAKDRIRTVVAYGSSGNVSNSDVEIGSESEIVFNNTKDVLNMIDVMEKYGSSPLPDFRRWRGHGHARLAAVTEEETEAAKELYFSSIGHGRRDEKYRRESLAFGMARLVP
ncbi:hypothetical protein MesoLj131b_71730 (plasmid) [Mesorhizobium sp. 131-2-5]|uniref:hypothetical protein n=1 Tax=Mesorhizobium sp. 131-2-5 TaxID=2744519 RepID=UPI0018EDDF8B|nr:hypothetical protein [Mesorhizobium sp. 131-2-5]BCH05174.1 hypothetical protein MesoLj131b_71730 [Mesorhizobium sp. 131-2-5]